MEKWDCSNMLQTSKQLCLWTRALHVIIEFVQVPALLLSANLHAWVGIRNSAAGQQPFVCSILPVIWQHDYEIRNHSLIVSSSRSSITLTALPTLGPFLLAAICSLTYLTLPHALYHAKSLSAGVTSLLWKHMQLKFTSPRTWALLLLRQAVPCTVLPSTVQAK